MAESLREQIEREITASVKASYIAGRDYIQIDFKRMVGMDMYKILSLIIERANEIENPHKKLYDVTLEINNLLEGMKHTGFNEGIQAFIKMLKEQ